jgi:hypothetical protein
MNNFYQTIFIKWSLLEIVVAKIAKIVQGVISG